eukprot:scaffold44025_cov58-Phaeocystis_antarctica.AAC.8
MAIVGGKLVIDWRHRKAAAESPTVVFEHGRRGSFSSARRHRSGSASACRRSTAAGRRKRPHAQSALAHLLAAAHAATRRARRPPACSGQPSGPERRALATCVDAEEGLRRRSGA